MSVLKGQERIVVQNNNFTDPVKNRCGNHTDQNRTLLPFQIKQNNDKQTDKHRDNIHDQLRVSIA